MGMVVWQSGSLAVDDYPRFEHALDSPPKPAGNFDQVSLIDSGRAGQPSDPPVSPPMKCRK